MYNELKKLKIKKMVLRGFQIYFFFSCSDFFLQGMILLCMIVLSLKVSNILDLVLPPLVQASEPTQPVTENEQKALLYPPN